MSEGEVLKSIEDGKYVLVSIPIPDETTLGTQSLQYFARRIPRGFRGDRIWFWVGDHKENGQRYGLIGGAQTRQYNDMRHAVEAVTVCRVECFGCGQVYEEEMHTGDEPRKDFVQMLMKDDWHYVNSAALAAIGIMCPECADEKDNDNNWVQERTTK